MKLASAFALLAATAREVLSSESRQESFATAASCKTISTDASWPANSLWTEAMPEVEPYEAVGVKSWKHANFRLDATEYAEVVAAVKFAREHNIRLSILNSGHDFQGRNDAPNGLAVVVARLKGARILTSFTPTEQGAVPVNSTTKPDTIAPQTEQAYVTFGAGLTTQELNSLLAPSKLFTLGAAHASVSVAGGWGQLAGHAAFSPKYGLGVDQVVEYKVVTADGQLRVANDVSNPDLFWALRGGGGGTYGIVVEATVKAYATQRVATSQFFINATDYNDHKSIYPAAAWYHTQFMEFCDKGVSAYYYMYPNAISIFTMSIGEEGTRKWMDANWKPIAEKMASQPGMDARTMVYYSSEYPDFWTFFRFTWGGIMPMARPAPKAKEPAQSSVNATIPIAKGETSHRRVRRSRQPFSHIYKRHGPGEFGGLSQSRGTLFMDSWLFGAEHLKSPTFAKALEDAMPPLTDGQYRGQFIGGGQVIALGANDSTSVLPAWRKSYLHIVQTGIGRPSSAAFRKFAPDMGSYANEAMPDMPGWRNAFFGSNYAKLLSIKRKYDADGLFWVTPGVDADSWTAMPDGRLCRSSDTNIRPSEVLEDDEGELPPVSDNLNHADQTKHDETRGIRFPYVPGPDGVPVLAASLLFGNLTSLLTGLGTASPKAAVT